MLRNKFQRERVISEISSKSRTEQAHKNQVNINTIMQKAMRGQYVPTNSKAPYYGDFTSATDFSEAQNSILAAQAAFMGLPPAIRQRFKNNPARLLEFLDNPDNRAEAENLGIISPVQKVPQDAQQGLQNAPESKNAPAPDVSPVPK